MINTDATKGTPGRQVVEECEGNSRMQREVTTNLWKTRWETTPWAVPLQIQRTNRLDTVAAEESRRRQGARPRVLPLQVDEAPVPIEKRFVEEEREDRSQGQKGAERQILISPDDLGGDETDSDDGAYQ